MHKQSDHFVPEKVKVQSGLEIESTYLSILS
jgi:hypothetical protein